MATNPHSIYGSPQQSSDGLLNRGNRVYRYNTLPEYNKTELELQEEEETKPYSIGEPPRKNEAGQILDSDGEVSMLPEGWQFIEDIPVFGGLVDLITDTGRDIVTGTYGARLAETAAPLFGGFANDEDIERYTKAKEKHGSLGQSKEHQEFFKILEENDGSLFGWMKAIVTNPTALTGIMVSSFAQMLNAPAVGAAATAGSTALAGNPFAANMAMGALSGTTETLASFTEFMQEELTERGLEFNEENIAALIKDKRAIGKIRARASARGVAIGTVDAIFLGLGKAAGTAIRTATKSTAKAALGVAGTEAIGGSLGEVAGQLAAGQELNSTEIILEGLAEIAGPGTVYTTGQVAAEAAGVTTPEDLKHKATDGVGAKLENLPAFAQDAAAKLSTLGIDINKSLPALQHIASKVANMVTAEGNTEGSFTAEQLKLDVRDFSVEYAAELQKQGIIPEGVDLNQVGAIISELANQTVTEAEVQGFEVFHNARPSEFIPDVDNMVQEASDQLVKDKVIDPSDPVANNLDVVNQAIKEEINRVEEESTGLDVPVPQIPRIIEAIANGLDEKGVIFKTIDLETVKPVIANIAEKVVGQIAPQGAVQTTPDVGVALGQLNAEAEVAYAEDIEGTPSYAIGPENTPIDKQGLLDHINSLSPEELSQATLQVNNDPALYSYLENKIQHANADLALGELPEAAEKNRKKIIDLQLMVDKYKGNDTVSASDIKAELTKRIKNLMRGLPEFDGIENAVSRNAKTPAKAVKDELEASEPTLVERAQQTFDSQTASLIELGDQLHAGKITTAEYNRLANKERAKYKAASDILHDKRGRRKPNLKNQETEAGGFKERAKSQDYINDNMLKALKERNGLTNKEKSDAILEVYADSNGEITMYKTVDTLDFDDNYQGRIVEKSQMKGEWRILPEELDNSVLVEAKVNIKDIKNLTHTRGVVVANLNWTKVKPVKVLRVDTDIASATEIGNTLKDITNKASKEVSLYLSDPVGLDKYFVSKFGKGNRVEMSLNAYLKKNVKNARIVDLSDPKIDKERNLLMRAADKIKTNTEAERSLAESNAYDQLKEQGKLTEDLTTLQQSPNEKVIDFGDEMYYGIIAKDNSLVTVKVNAKMDGYTFESWDDMVAYERGEAIVPATGTRKFWSPELASKKLRITEQEYKDKHGDKPISTNDLNNLITKRNYELGRTGKVTLDARSMNAYVQDFNDLLENPEMLIMYPHFAYEVYEKTSRNPEFTTAFPEAKGLEGKAAQTWIQGIFDPSGRRKNTNKLNKLQQFWNEELGLGRAITWDNSYLQAMEEIAIENTDLGIERVNYGNADGSTTYGSYSFPIDGKRGVIAPQLSLNDTTQKPDTISHELSHAWHQVTMYDRPKLAEKVKQLTQDSYGPRILEQAMDQGLYGILTIDGRNDEAFAMMMGREVTRLLFENSVKPLGNKTSKAKQLHKLNDLREEVQNWTIDDIKTIQDLAKVVAVETYLGDTVIYGDYIDINGDTHKLGFDFSADNRNEAGGYSYNKLIKRNVRQRNSQQVYGSQQTERTSVQLSNKEKFEQWYKQDLVEEFKSEVESEYGLRAELKAAIGEKDYWGLHLGTVEREFDSIVEEIGPAQTKRLLVAMYTRDMWQGFEKDKLFALIKKLQHVEMEKTPVDQDFDALVKQLATPDGKIIVSRVVMVDTEFDSIQADDIGSSWSVDPDFQDYWIKAQGNAGAQGYTPYVFYTEVNLNDPNVIPVGQYEGTTQSEIMVLDQSSFGEIEWDIRDPKKTWKIAESHSTRRGDVLADKGVIDQGFLERTIKKQQAKKDKATKLKVDDRAQEQKAKDLAKAKIDILNVVQGVQNKYAKSNSQRKREIANLSAEEIVENTAKAFQGIGDFDNLGASLERLGRFVLPGLEVEVDAVEDETNGATNEKLEARKDAIRRNVSAGWQIYEGLEALGYVGIDVGWKGTDPFTVTIENDKVMADLVESAGLETAEKGAWTKVQTTIPTPYTGFVHEETKLQLISNADKSARQQNQAVLDVANRASQIPYETHSPLLDIYNQLDLVGLLAIEEAGVDLNKLTPSEKREHLKALDSKVMEYKFILNEANKAATTGLPFYQMHRYDFRGRLYATPSYFNHQGSKLALSLFQFANKEPMGESGWKWAMIQAADTEGSRYAEDGTELTLLDQRYDYAESQLEKWLEVARDPMKPENLEFWQSVDEPFLFLATILELKAAMDSGNPLAYESGLPIHQDATNSGGQVLVALMKDVKGARVANMLPDKIRGDLYNEVGQGVLEQLPDVTPENQAVLDRVQTKLKELWDAIENAPNREANKEAFAAYVAWKKENKEDVTLANQLFWSQGAMRQNIRKIVKGPVMTKYYSAGVDTMAEQVLKKFKSKYPYMTIDQAKYLASQLEKTANKIMPGPAELMRLFQTLAGRVSKTGNPITVTAPYNGFKMVQNPRTQEQIKQKLPYNGPNEKIAGRSTNNVISVAMRVGNTGLDAKKAKSSIAPNMVHMMDAQLVAWLLTETGYDVQTIHDSFGASPANAQQLYTDIREAFVQIFEGDVLPGLLAQMMGEGKVTKESLAAVEKELGKLKNYNTGLDISGMRGNEFAFSAGKGFGSPSQITSAQRHKKELSFREQAQLDARSVMEEDIMEATKPCSI